MPGLPSLFEAIEGLVEVSHPLRSLLLEALRLVHVYLLELTIEVGRGDVNWLKVEVFKHREGKGLGPYCK